MENNIKKQTCPRRCRNRSPELKPFRTGLDLFNMAKAMFLLKNQGGFALVVTLLLMVSVSIIGLLALMNASTETLITRNEKEQKVAFQLAEAGLNEAYARVQLSGTANPPLANYMGYTTEATYACGSTTCNFNDEWPGITKSAGSAGEVVGGLTTGTYTMTVTYATENSDTFCNGDGCGNGEIVRFGQDFGFLSTMVPTPPANGYLPVYKMTSTGTYKDTKVNLTSYVAASSLNTRTRGAVDSNANPPLNISGGATPTMNGSSGACVSPYTDAGCATTNSPLYNLNTQLGDTILNIKSMADERHATGVDIASTGNPDIDSIVTDWGDAAGDTRSTIIYIDNDAAANDAINGVSVANEVRISGNFAGRGILVVTGDITFSGGFDYEGLVYVMGTLTLSGGGNGNNITGGIIAGSTVAINGSSMNITFDQATLDAVARESGGSAVVRWSRQ